MPVAPPIRILLALSLTTWVGGCSAPPSDPLPSWYDGPSKSAILTFVARVTKEGSPDYVKPGGVEFMRAFAEETYGIPPEQVVGSSGVVKFEIKDGTPQLIKEPKIEFIDDGTGKPVGINRFIGRRPIMAFGNSDGDLQMLQYATAGEGPRFGLIVHHTDGEREVAYDRESHIGKLDKTLDQAPARGWTVVDMKKEWKTVFP